MGIKFKRLLGINFLSSLPLYILYFLVYLLPVSFEINVWLIPSFVFAFNLFLVFRIDKLDRVNVGWFINLIFFFFILRNKTINQHHYAFSSGTQRVTHVTQWICMKFLWSTRKTKRDMLLSRTRGTLSRFMFMTSSMKWNDPNTLYLCTSIE